MISDLTKEAIEVFLKHLTDRIALAFVFLSIALLGAMLIPGPVGTWARGQATWLVFGAFGLCYLPTRFLLEKVSEWQTGRKREMRLKNLTPRERTILSPYILNDFRSRRFLHTDPVARGLADDGILYRPNVPRDQGGKEAYNIHDWARKYLRDHMDLVGGFQGDAQGDL